MNNQNVLTSGKYTGQTYETIINENPGYCDFIYNNEKLQSQGLKDF